ncbi:MAG: MarR family winged helix-turn-helix transcriptional regulator [Clostridia bacterium]|nr:MarR family winged helix-turn-helix transcriptional regulator [Clostridia bacterium]
MPTQYTKSVAKMRYLQYLRRVMLQSKTSQAQMNLAYTPILMHINCHPDCTQAEIANALHLTPAALTLATKKMEKLDLLRKKTDEKNMRRKILVITENGIKYLEMGRKIFDEIDCIMFSGFSEEEITQLNDFLGRITLNLEKQDEISKLNSKKVPWDFQ